MSQTVINFKTDSKLKAQAKEVLDEMGLNFSIVLNNFLKKLVLEKRIEFTTSEVPNDFLRKVILESIQEVKSVKYREKHLGH